jgi:hypothetical protein
MKPRPLALFFFGGVRTHLPSVQNKYQRLRLSQIGGQTSDEPEASVESGETSLPTREMPSCQLSTKFGISEIGLIKSATFFASVPAQCVSN